MAAQSSMLQSVYLRTKLDAIEWTNAVAPVSTMTAIDPHEPLFLSQFSTPQIHNYDLRDKELSYRDLVLAGLLAMVGYQATGVWGMPLRRLSLPTYVSNVLYTAADDRDIAALASPANVTQVGPLSNPYQAFFVDKGMYSRDVVLLEAMARLCKVFSSADIPIAQVEPLITIDNLWSLSSEQAAYSDIGININLDQNTFGIPDKNLAFRDNDLAALIAEMNRQLLNIFAVAERLYIQVTGAGKREPEVYSLISETATTRVFAAEPFLPNRLRLVYYKSGSLQWFTEDYRDLQVPQDVYWGIPSLAPVDVFSFSGVLPNQTYTVVPEKPDRYDATKGYGLDSQWYHQKASQINFESTKWGERQNGVMYFSTLTNSNRSIQLPLTENLGAGLHRVSVKILPTGTAIDHDVQLFVLLDSAIAYATLSVVPDRTDVVSFDLELATPLVLTDVTLPYLTISLGSTLVNITGISVENWDIRSQRTVSTTVNALAFSGWHGEIQNRVIENVRNSYTDNLKLSSIIPEYRELAGIEATAFVPYAVRINHPSAKPFTSEANSTLIRITATTGFVEGDSIVFVPSDDLPVIKTVTKVWQENETHYMSGFVTVTIDSALSPTLPFSGTCRIKDTVVFTATGLPLGIAINSSTGILSGTFGPATVGNYTSIVTVAGSLDATTNILWHIHSLLLPTTATSLWTSTSTGSWMTAIEVLYEQRLTTSHRLGRPFDIGRPALVPDGLELTLDGEVTCTNNALRSVPVYRAFQPWMIDSGIYVMEDGFEGLTARIAFDYLVDSTGYLLLQSPDTTWWRVSTVESTGEMQADSITFSGVSLSEDLTIEEVTTFGFSDTNGVWRVGVDSIGEVTTVRFLPCDAVELINYTIAFSNGYGPVFRLSGTSSYGRLAVSDIGELEIEEI